MKTLSIIRFTLSITGCLSLSFSGTGAGFSITEGRGSASSDINVNQRVLITDITVTLRNLQHGARGQLIATLKHVESNLIVYIFNRPTDTHSADFDGDYSFNDIYPNYFPLISSTPSGNYFPSSGNVFAPMLSTLRNKLALGTWRLKLEDLISDYPSLGSWSLDIVGDSDCSDHCSTCTSDGCDLCEEDYFIFLDNAGKRTCIQPTPELSWSDGSVTRYYYFSSYCDGSGTATKCLAPCVKCSTTEDNCDSCQPNSYLLTKTDGKITCISSPKSSSLNQGADGIQRGFYFTGNTDGTGQAVKCVSPCRECESPEICTSCPPNELLFFSTAKPCTYYNQCIPAQYLTSVDDSIPPKSYFTYDSLTKVSEGVAEANLCKDHCLTCTSERKC